MGHVPGREGEQGPPVSYCHAHRFAVCSKNRIFYCCPPATGSIRMATGHISTIFHDCLPCLP
jgi:hypothetical protein